MQHLTGQAKESATAKPEPGKGAGTFPGAALLLLLLFCVDAGAVATTRYPLVLHHGFNAAPGSNQSFNPRLVEVLQSDGQTVFTTAVSPFNSIAVRAFQLRTQLDLILAREQSTKVNIIAHSMGGLDARYLISTLGYQNKIASLTTISTPHRGTLLADAALRSSSIVGFNVLDALARALGGTYSNEQLSSNSDVLAALNDLSTIKAGEFNRLNPDKAGIFYQSWAGLSNVGGIPGPHDVRECESDNGTMHQFDQHRTRDAMTVRFIPAAWFVAAGTALKPNDGIVTVESARWGKFNGCIPADHLDEIGQVDARGPDRRTGFDFIAFYRQVIADLVERGY